MQRTQAIYCAVKNLMTLSEGNFHFRNSFKKRFLRCFVFVSLIQFILQNAYAQSVTILRPPINPADCVTALQLYSGTLVNLTQEPLNVFMQGQVSYGLCNGSLEPLAEGSTSNFTIPVGNLLITVQNAEAILAPVDYNFLNNSLEQTYFNTGCLVPGCYEVCFQVIAAGTTNILGQLCYNFEIQAGIPLLLISPFDQSEQATLLPLFTWTPQRPIEGASYRLRIFELFGFQNAYSAVQSNPVFYEAEGLFNNIHLYSVAARQLVPCREYAWQVTYESNTGRAFAESEIWGFRMACPDSTEVIAQDEEEEVAEDQPSPGFIIPRHTDAGEYLAIQDKKLYLAMHNPYSLSEITFEVKDQAGQTVRLGNKLRTFQKENYEESTGENWLALDLENTPLKAGNYYTLIITAFGKPRYVRFVLASDHD